jgi:transcriptional regulator with XRE-family HTH domain
MAREKPSTPPPDPPEICARIRQLREEAGVKQHVLGLVSGVPLNTISEIAQADCR